MFAVGEKVLYSVNGVCEITGITQKVFGKTKIDYYVLKPIFNEASTVFVPVGNDALVKKMKKLMSPQQLDEVFYSVSATEVEWNNDEVTRRQNFKDVISSGIVEDILVILKALWNHRKSQNEKGRKLHISDEIFLKEAEKMIKEEISCVIGVEKEDVIPYVQNKIMN